MRLKTSHRSFLCLACIIFTFVLVLSSPVLATSRCSAVQQWVESHRGHLPTSSEELARFPVDQRMAIVAALDPETRSRLWQEHFRFHLAKDLDLTVAQREVLEEAIQIITPELFAEDTGDPLIKNHLEIELPKILNRAIELFGTDRALELMTQIGPTPKSLISDPKCKCATSPGDTCGAERYCDDTVVCTPTRTGCGPGGVYACNGMCTAL